MSLRTSQIIKLLLLKKMDRKSLLSTATDFDQLSDSDLREVLQRYYFRGDLDKAFDQGEEILEKSAKAQIKIVSFQDKDYPQSLKAIPDFPVVLNFKGNYASLNQLSGIALVGTRNPDAEGLKVGEYLGEYFGSKGFNVISGLAKGCDTAGHKGCLKARGITTAVLAHGLDMIYPSENESLAEEIISCGGLLVSEYFMGTEALPNHFIERDRLQAGLAKAVVVIQSEITGSTMYTVNYALEYKKLLAAVKYQQKLDLKSIQGNELLIREGKAIPVSEEDPISLEKLSNL